MPSAAVNLKLISSSTPTTATTNSKDKDMDKAGYVNVIDLLEPFKQTVTLVEHKIRNMEKRKGKLDAYKQEQEQGKELNADQLAAVAKYGEVVQTLEFARDLVKSVNQIQVDTNRLLKKQQKKDQVEKAAADLERSKQTILLSSCLQKLAIPSVREDFASGKNGAILVGTEELKALDELCVISGLQFKRDRFKEQLEKAAEHLVNLVDGKPKPVCASSSKTYKDLKELLTSLTDSEYFDKYRETKVGTNAAQDKSEQTEEVLSTTITGRNSAQMLSQTQVEENYKNFMKDPQAEIVTPHMDPAVVAVSSYAPPQMGSQVHGPQHHAHQTQLPQQQSSDSEANVYTSSSSDSVRSHQGMGDMNLNHLRNDGSGDCGEISEWSPVPDDKSQSSKYRKNSGHQSDTNDEYGMGEFFDQFSSRGNNNWDAQGGGGDGVRGYRRGGGDRGRRTNGFSNRGDREGFSRGRGNSNRWTGPPNERYDDQEYRNNYFDRGDREYKPRGGGGRGGVGNNRGGNYFNGAGGRGSRGTGRPYRPYGQDQGPVNAY